MSLISVVKHGEYSLMSNFHLTDSRLSWKAKGLLSALLSLSGEYFDIDNLAEVTHNGKFDTGEGLEELERHGYLTWEQIDCDKDGFPIIRCTIYERPMSKEHSSYTVAELPGVEEITSASKTVSPKSNEEEMQISLRERLNLKRVAEKFSGSFVEMVFIELCRRDAEFRQIMTAKAFESVCLEVWKRQQSESISSLSDLMELIKMCFDNIALGIRSASGGNEPAVQKEMIENPSANRYHRDK